MRDVVRILLYLFLSSFIDTLFLYIGSCDRFYTYIVLIFLYMWMYVSFTYSFTYLYMCCFFSLFIHMFLITCMQSIISVSH